MSKRDELTSDEADTEFNRIITAALDEAEKVPCSIQDYYAGLKAMRSELVLRIQIVASEVGDR